MKNLFYRKIRVIVSIVIVSTALLFTACSAPQNTNKQGNTGTNNTNNTQTNKNKTYKIGDTAESAGMAFTVNGVRESTGSEFFKPKEGNTFYIVDATVENKTNDPQTVSSIMMFKLVDSKGYSHEMAIGADTKGQLDGEVGAGRKLSGELAYEIAKDTKSLELEIDPSVLGTGILIFKLDR